MLGLIDTDLKQTRFYQEVFSEGRQEGRQEESAQLALRLLQRLSQEGLPRGGDDLQKAGLDS